MDIQREVNDLSYEVERAKQDLSLRSQYVSQEVTQGELDEYNQKREKESLAQMRSSHLQSLEASYISAGDRDISPNTKSLFNKVTVPTRLIVPTHLENQYDALTEHLKQQIQVAQERLDQSANKKLSQEFDQDKLNPEEDPEGDNESQQTFGERCKNSDGKQEYREKLEQIDYLIQKTKEEKEEEELNMVQDLLTMQESVKAEKKNEQTLPLRTETIQPLKISESLIELDLIQILSGQNESQGNVKLQFDKDLEGKEVFDLLVGFVGTPQSGKSTVISSICKEDWDIKTQIPSCNGKLQINRYSCIGKRVGLCESDQINDFNFMHFICNFAQAIVFTFNSWDNPDQRVFSEYIKLLQSENNFASECIVIHSKSELLSAQTIEKITQDLTKLQDGLFRGKVDGKIKKINVYHLMLHNYNDSTLKKAIFDETIAVCRGTIIGKLTSSKEKIDIFRKLNKFLIS